MSILDDTFVTSDFHFYHNNIMKHCARTHFMTDRDRGLFADAREDPTGARMRRFRPSDDSVGAMNHGIVANVNARVPRDATLWCLGDWAMMPKRHDQRGEYYRKCRDMRDRIHCQNIVFVWGNHDDPAIADLFARTYDQVQVRFDDARVTFNHYPMVTWNGQHRGTAETPNVCLYGHVHDKETTPKLFVHPQSWAALDVGVDSHDYQVYSLREAVDHLKPHLASLVALKQERDQFDPYRGRGHRVAAP